MDRLQQELTSSAIDDRISALNFEEIDGIEAFDFIVGSKAKRRNDGRLTDASLRLYENFKSGGWRCRGIDVLTMQASEWGCFKPHAPRMDENKRKPIKYEHPYGRATELFALRINWKIGFKISTGSKLRGIYGQRILHAIAANEAAEKGEAAGGSKAGVADATKHRAATGARMGLELGSPGTVAAATQIVAESNVPCNGVECEIRPESKFLNSKKSRKAKAKTEAEVATPIRLSPLEEVKVLEFINDFGEEEDADFWQWAIDTPDLPILVTEGAKKAASLLSAGYCAIGLPGIYGGYRSRIEGNPVSARLIPQMLQFACKGRDFIFAFDRDRDPKTIANVRTAISRTAGLLEQRGCSVSALSWHESYKGVDDLIFALGAERLGEIYGNRLEIDRWRLEDNFSLDRYDTVRVDSRYLDPAIAPEDFEGKIVAIRSAKGTGKTELLAKWVAPFIDDGRGVLVITHRVQLAQNLAERLGIPHVSEVRAFGKLLGYALCVDSLHANSQAQFDPLAWDESAIVIDEIEQVVWHMLNSETCQGKRTEILNNFEQLVQNCAGSGGTIFMSDADLSGVSIEYVQKLSGGMPLWLLINEHRPVSGKRTLTHWRSPGTMLSNAVAAIARGENIILHCAAQQVTSKWAAQNLEQAIAQEFPGLPILCFDSETIADPEHPAFGIVNRLDDLKNYRVVIATTVIETGLSIEGDHFDAVYALANGVQTVDAVCQTIERVRADVPRHLAITTGGIGWIGNGSSNPRQTIKSQNQMAKFNLAALSGLDALLAYDGIGLCHMTAWSNFAAKVNLGYRNYRQNILDKLSGEGYEIIDPSSPTPDPDRQQETSGEDFTETTKNWDERMGKISAEGYQQLRQAIINAPIPDRVELQRLRKQRGKNKAQRLKMLKGNLCQRYATKNVTDDLIAKDDAGWYSQIRLHYYLTVGREFLADKDRHKLESIAYNGQISPLDVNRACLVGKVQVLDSLNIQQFLDAEDEFFNTERLQHWNKLVLQYQAALKNSLGVKIHEKTAPIPNAQRLLGLLGLKLTYVDQVRDFGKPSRRYAGIACNFDDGRKEIFERWLERDRAAACHTDANNLLVENSDRAVG